MRFLLAFVLSFLSVFAIAQAPPMTLGGPQGIDVTRLLVRNWMTTPIYVDTPVTPLTGFGWPGRGYLITVVKNQTPCQNCPPKDTTLWIYTGARWKRVGYDYLTRLIYGGDVAKAVGSGLNYTIQPYGAFFDGDYQVGSNVKTATLTTKVVDSTSRIDVLVLNRDSFQVKTGVAARVPKKPIVTGSEIEVASFYFRAFDSVPLLLSGSSVVTNLFRIPGRDSIYYTISNQTFAIKDSIGISKNDTAAMLNPYKFTAANGLTKDSTVFRLGGSLNQNTNINLNTRRLSFIGGSDTTRFFSNGRVSIGGTPDSLSMLRVNGDVRITGNTTYNGNLLPLPISGGALYVAGFTRGINTYDPARLQVYTNGGLSPMQYLELGSGEINHTLNSQIFFNRAFGYDFHSLGVKGIFSSAPGGANTYNCIKVFPEIRIGPTAGTDTTFLRGFDFRPKLDSFNNVRIIPFTNTVGSNMFNTTWGNTRIGYPLSELTINNTTAYDTTFKLDVNGDARVTRLLVNTTTVDTSSAVNIVSTTKGFLQPRMTNTQKGAITTPATGLQLFSTTDSANYVYRGTGGGWQKIANEISGSATLDFPSTNGNNKSDLVINGVTGVSEGDVVSLGVPNISVENHSCYTAWVNATNQVTVRFNNYGTGALDPQQGTFKIKVFK